MFQTILYKGHYIHSKPFEGREAIQVNLVTGEITQTIVRCNTMQGAKRVITKHIKGLSR